VPTHGDWLAEIGYWAGNLRPTDALAGLAGRLTAMRIASKKLVGADQITAKELSPAQIKALKLREGDVLL
jgi:hypothetical protein